MCLIWCPHLILLMISHSHCVAGNSKLHPVSINTPRMSNLTSKLCQIAPNDLKKSQICPISGQSDPIRMTNLTWLKQIEGLPSTLDYRQILSENERNRCFWIYLNYFLLTFDIQIEFSVYFKSSLSLNYWQFCLCLYFLTFWPVVKY